MELKVWVSIAYHNKSNTFMKSQILVQVAFSPTEPASKYLVFKVF